MRRHLPLATCCLPLLLITAGLAAQTAGPGELRTHWEREVLSLAQWAPETTYDAGSGVVEFTGAEGRRLRASLSFPATAGAGAALHLGEAAGMGSGDGLAHMYLPVDAQKPGRALLDAYQALSVLLSAPGVPAGKVALVGRGEGAALAVALAALRPGEVGCMVAVDPRGPAGKTVGWDLGELTALVRCPTLVLVTREGQAGPAAAALAGSLAGPVQMAAVAGRPEAVWSAWVAGVLAQEPPPGPVGEDEPEYEPTLPVDLSRQ